jgi:hypothetical protein
MVLMSVALWIRGVADLEAGLSRRIPICGCAAHAAGGTVYDINPAFPSSTASGTPGAVCGEITLKADRSKLQISDPDQAAYRCR